MRDLSGFLRFVVERHRIWEKRQAGEVAPWTDDPILAAHKFTNVFRVLDPGTQFLLTDVFDPELSERNNLLRAFLYRYTGKIEVWEFLALTVGLPTAATLDETYEAIEEYRGVTVRPGLSDTNQETVVREAARPVFTGAYFVPTPAGVVGVDKLENVFGIAKRAFTPGGEHDMMPAWKRAQTYRQRYKALRACKGVGDFMAMQILTDWAYQSGTDYENDYLMPGPGSRKGAKALDPDASTMDVVRRVVEEIRALPDCPRLGARPPSLMDIGSNLLCEWSKYVRHRERGPKDKPYEPAHPGPQPAPVLPRYYENEDIL